MPALAPNSDAPPGGRLLMPALRWDGASYVVEGGELNTLLDLGVAGFILFGGTSTAAARLTTEVRARTRRPLLFAADLERGGGQQFVGLPGLPPLAALGAVADPGARADALRSAGRETARAARAVGIGLVFAPVADLGDIEPDNPIVGTRALGGSTEAVAEAIGFWIDGCLAEGVACCVKHYPGHGRTRTDSHAELPVVETPGGELAATDLLPFRRAVEAGVPAVMTAHVAYPALDPSGRPATRSPAILGRLRESGFEGVIVSDALIMAGAGELAESVREGLGAGVDLMLYPEDAALAAAALATTAPELRAAALRRVDGLVARFADPPAAGAPPPPDPAACAALCDAVLGAGSPLPPGTPLPNWVRIRSVDDDAGGPYPPPSRTHLRDALLQLGVPVGERDTESEAERRECLAVVAVFSEPRAWKGRAGPATGTVEAARAAIEAARRGGEVPLLLCFGGPRVRADLVAAFPEGAVPPVLLAWGGEPAMQRAAARRIARFLRPDRMP